MAVELSQLHRLSVDEYHRLLEAGGFGETRVELLDGLLADMSPKTREHENAVAWLARWLFTHADPATFEIRVGAPLTLARSEPEPDLAVIARTAPRPYHPATATLVVEIAVSSLQRDLATKAPQYAAAGVDEYWVLDLEGRRLIVFGGAQREREAYAARAEYGEAARITAAALDLPPLAVADLLAAAAG